LCWPNKKRPSRKDVDAFIDDQNTDLEQVFKDVLVEMKNANGVKLATKNLQA
ncbi:tail assembly chaperone, partial [Limosilactobacillus fermentum]